jgi:opacity protein-like surface antigen
MKTLNVFRIGVLAALMAPAAVAAQDSPRGYVQGLAGAARAVETGTVYAGLGAWRVNGRVDVFGEVGRMRNALGPELRDRLDVIEAQLRASNRAQFGTEFPIVFAPLVPTWYGFGGVRAHGPSAGRFSTYVEGGAGTARLDPQVHLTVNGENLDSEVAALTGLGNDSQQLEFIAGGGAGLAVQAWKRIRIEAGYRYMRMFGHAKTNINRVHAGAGWTF